MTRVYPAYRRAPGLVVFATQVAVFGMAMPVTGGELYLRSPPVPGSLVAGRVPRYTVQISGGACCQDGHRKFTTQKEDHSTRQTPSVLCLVWKYQLACACLWHACRTSDYASLSYFTAFTIMLLLSLVGAGPWIISSQAFLKKYQHNGPA